jgi:quercetin dioxygenase-like cupin family protein
MKRLLAFALILPAIVSAQSSGDLATGRATPAFSVALPNVPGTRLTGVVVEYAPGGKTAKHWHAGSVYAYVLEGKIRSENSETGPAKVYSAGEGFFEPPGSAHVISENASNTEPAKLLAIFVAEYGATLTTMQPPP